MRCDTCFAGAEDRVAAVETLDGRAAAAWLALVARRCGVIEVGAARALQEVASGRSHVAQLCRCTRQDGARKQRVALLDQGMVSEVGVRHEGADPQASVGSLILSLERQL